MTVTVSNTNLVDSFNTWRLNTNLIATTMSNNVVTVSRAGGANRGGAAKGNSHITGTFSATNLRTSSLRAGNTTSKLSLLTISSNVSVNTATVQIYANTTFHGNVIFNTVGTDRITFGDSSRWRLTGGTAGQYLRFTGSNQVDFKTFTLRDVADLSSNSASIILSGSNTTFSDNADSPKLIFASRNRSDGNRVSLFASNASLHSTSLYLQLADDSANSKFVITDSGNTALHFIDSYGRFYHQSNTIFNGTATFNGTSTFNGTMNINGNVNVGDAASDIMNVSSRSDLYGDTNIGNANTDTISVIAQVDSNFTPATDNTYLLGKDNKEWKKVFANNVTSYSVTLPGGDVQTQIDSAGQNSLAFAIALG